MRRLVSSVTQANFNCGASAKVTVLSLTTSCLGLLFLASLCIFFCFLSFVRKKCSNFEVDKLASCIRTFSFNASMPRSTPSLFAGYPICMTKEKGWVKRHDIIKAFT